MLCIVQAILNVSLRLACKLSRNTNKYKLIKKCKVICVWHICLKTYLLLFFFCVLPPVSSQNDRDQFPSNSSALCQNEQQNSTQFGFCCSKVPQLLRENRALKAERDHLQVKIRQLHEDKTRCDEEFSGSAPTNLLQTWAGFYGEDVGSETQNSP